MNSKLAFSGVIVAGAVLAMAAANSGLNKGESVSPFHPKHVAGALKGSTGCFPCTFQNRPQVQVWMNGVDEKAITAFAGALDNAMAKNAGAEFKAMIVIVAPKSAHKMIEDKGAMMGEKFKNVSIAYLDASNPAVKAYKINTSDEVKNTVFAYKNWKVVDKMVNVTPDAKGLSALGGAVSTLVK